MIIEVARYIIWYIMRLLNATLLVNCKKIWYGKQKHLGCKKNDIAMQEYG